MIGKAAVLAVKIVGVLLIVLTCGVGVIFTVLMLALEAVGRLALEFVRSPFARSGGLLAALFGGALWLFLSAFRN
jgi:Cu/Ag efflux pump CusA